MRYISPGLQDRKGGRERQLIKGRSTTPTVVGGKKRGMRTSQRPAVEGERSQNETKPKEKEAGGTQRRGNLVCTEGKWGEKHWGAENQKEESFQGKAGTTR